MSETPTTHYSEPPPERKVTVDSEKKRKVGLIVEDGLMVRDSKTHEPLVTMGGHADGGRIDLWRRANREQRQDPAPVLSLIASQYGGVVIVYRGSGEELALMVGNIPLAADDAIRPGLMVFNEQQQPIGTLGADEDHNGRLNLSSADGERKFTATGMANGGGLMTWGEHPDAPIAALAPNEDGGANLMLYGNRSEEPVAVVSGTARGSVHLSNADTQAGVELIAHPELGVIVSYDGEGKRVFPEDEEPDYAAVEMEAQRLAGEAEPAEVKP